MGTQVKQQPSYALYILRRLSYKTGSIPCLLRDIPKIPLIFASTALPLLTAPLPMRGHTMGHHLYHPGGISCVLVKEGWCWWYRKYAIGETVSEGREASGPIRRGSGGRGAAIAVPWWSSVGVSQSLSKVLACYSAQTARRKT